MFSYCGCEIQIPSFSRWFMPFFNIIHRRSTMPNWWCFFLSQKIGWGLTPSILQFSCVNTETTPMKQVFYHFIILYHCLVIGRFFCTWFSHIIPLVQCWLHAPWGTLRLGAGKWRGKLRGCGSTNTKAKKVAVYTDYSDMTQHSHETMTPFGCRWPDGQHWLCIRIQLSPPQF